MPGPADVALGNVNLIMNTQVTQSPTSVANATTAEQTFAVPRLRVNDVVTVVKPAAQAGLGIVGARVSAADTLAITFCNVTAATITPTASEAYLVNVCRSYNTTLPSVI